MSGCAPRSGSDRRSPGEKPGNHRILSGRSGSHRQIIQGWMVYPGDLGYLTNDGALVLQGRRDDMMIFDGMNIFPAEIENALRSHHAVREAAAFAVNHWRFQDVPVAAVTLRGRVSEQELVEHCGRILGFRNPLRIWIIKDFPRNPMGKILKRELVRHLVQSGKK